MKGQIRSANLGEQKASESQAGQNYRIIFHSRHRIRIRRLRAAKSQLGEQLRDIDRLPQSYHGGCRDDRQQTSQIYLNGTWQFVPAVGNPQSPPASPSWGSIQVPGDWQEEKSEFIPGIITRGTGVSWEKFNSKQLSKAWYQRNIDISSDWKNRRIFIDLARVSTDAIIFVNGINCGQIEWPYGTVEITKAAKPGQNTISILVAAVSDEKDKAVIMSPTEIYTEKSNLHSRGIIGEVRVFSAPPGPLISDVFVQTSTRNKQVKLDVELADVTQNGQVQLVAEMVDEKGKIEQNLQELPTFKLNQSKLSKSNGTGKIPASGMSANPTFTPYN